MVQPVDHAQLYWDLRNELLTRFFAFGRYFRNNLLSQWNHLGVVLAAGSASPGDKDDASVDAMTGLTHRPKDSTGTEIYASGATASAPPTLIGLNADQALLERWRIAWHERNNPLMLTGQLLTCLAIEYHLGRKTESAPIIREILITFRELFKFPNAQDNRSVFSGYILRWDAVTSDQWLTDKTGTPIICDNFLVGALGQYLYSIPFNHPAYVPLSDHVDPAARLDCIRRFRLTEPSYDELVGLVAGYDIVHRFVDDPVIRSMVEEQTNRLGSYLSSCGYLLVRPGGGFTAQGASGIGPALEYAFTLVFQRITGTAYPSKATFEDACRLAGVWGMLEPVLANYMAAGRILASLLPLAIPLIAAAGGVTAAIVQDVVALVGPAAQLLLPLGAPVSTIVATMTALIPQMLDLLSLVTGNGPDAQDASYIFNHAIAQTQFGDVLGASIALFENPKFIDVLNNELGLAYPLMKLFDPQTRFTAAMRGLSINRVHAYSENFPPYVGLTALDRAAGSPEDLVGDLYLYWMNRRSGIPDDASARSAELSYSHRGFARGVALVLGDTSGTASIQSYLDGCFARFTNPTTGKRDLTVTDDQHRSDPMREPGIAKEVIGSLYASGTQDEALEYMVTLALCWLAVRRAEDAGSPDPGVPGFPFSNTPMPSPSIPDSIVTSGIVPAFSGRASGIGTNLFPTRQTAPTSRPPDPPAQLPPVAQTDSHVISVSATQADVDTGIGVSQWDQVTFAATGSIWAGDALIGRNGPEGLQDHIVTDGKYPLHVGQSAYRFSLLVRFVDPFNPDPTAPYFYIGPGQVDGFTPYIHQTGAPKRILLRINDDQPGDGNGEFTCTVTVQRAATSP